MIKQAYKSLPLFAAILLLFFTACNEEHPHVGEKEIVEKPEDINVRAEEVIQGTLKDILQNNKDIQK